MSTLDGQRVGWLDLGTGHEVVERADLGQKFHTSLAAYRTAEPLPIPVAAERAAEIEDLVALPPAARAEADYAATVDWTDLALNRPSQAVRAEAEARLAAMKHNSKVGTFLKRAFDV